MSTLQELYAYPEPNSVLMANLELLSHPEGGFYAETVRIEDQMASPYSQPVGQSRSLATQIYYLITPQSPRGRMHLNLGLTFHTLHAGRALYTLFRPATATEPAVLRHVVMGADSSKGEVKQLFVPGGWWKASEIPQDDLATIPEGDQGDSIGCLISEVVVPGFDFGDHSFLSEETLVGMFNGDSSAPEVVKLLPYCKSAQ